MTLDQLVALDAIIATGTFRAAADRLNKAQSAVSHQIRKLEDELGFDVLSRDAYRPSLTPEGEVFYRETARVLEQVRALKSVAAGLRSAQAPAISIAMKSPITERLISAQMPPIFMAGHLCILLVPMVT